ncbi:cation diffusion facilitator family transporter [Konateibacter massiliensis]|uniref:cation diffusion facilitator family transporter n=1 Tax=Konateibacter massiliensis TaxID=2002841 RepID=UPI000C15A4CE|nr:cation diffusion facilitator family transporter [Konateibacter massiliensis]
MSKAANESLSRQSEIMRVSGTGIVTNVILAILKFFLGTISGSIAISSDAVNNLADSSSSLITMIGTKLAQKEPNEKHPFGYGRIEYLTSMIIAIIVLVTGAEMTITSVKNILEPQQVSYSTLTLVILFLTIFIKIGLGIYTKNAGKKLLSGALVASGADAQNDAVISAVALIAALVYRFTDVSIDAYAGTVISIFVIKTGYDVLRETLNQILGERGGRELSENIYEEIRAEKGILGVHDLILNNYGPNTYTGSINVEIDHDRTVEDIYPILHRLQVRIFQKFHAYLVFGIYAVNSASPISKRVWEILSEFEAQEKHCLGCHGIVVDEEQKQVFCDVILDFKCDRAALQEKVQNLLLAELPDYQVIVTIDTEFA